MSVLVKGMEMPKCCSMCNFNNQWGYCLAYGCGTERGCPNHDKPDWCPLIEVPTPHGRLIDSEVLHNEMYHRAFETDGDTQWQSGCWVRYRAIEQVHKSVPTVIEAEE